MADYPENAQRRLFKTQGGITSPVTQEGGGLTYFATSSFGCDTTATDIAFFQGAANVTASIQWILISGNITVAAQVGDLTVLRRTAANTAGTAVAATLGQADTTNDAAPACTVKHYTAHPTALGAAATNPNLFANRFSLPLTPAVNNPPLLISFGFGFGCKTCKVIGASDFICINVPAALGTAGNAWDITWCWVETTT